MGRAELSVGRILLVLFVAIIGGMQVGLYMADWYDDGVAAPLSLWIGIVILLGAAGLALRPFFRSSR